MGQALWVKLRAALRSLKVPLGVCSLCDREALRAQVLALLQETEEGHQYGGVVDKTQPSVKFELQINTK